jgi:hypothetical protein
MAAHSVLVGGSIADRRIHCPASFQEQLKAPPGTTSIYADLGTSMHEAMAHWLQNPDDDLVGMTFYEHTITQEDVETLLTPAWDALVELQEIYGGGFKVAHLEKRVSFPGIAGAFGTVDVILESPSYFIIADFKFGAGVFVPCKYEDDTINSQLLFYLAGAAKKLPKKKKMAVAILQPTFAPGLAHAAVSRETLTKFETKLHEAVALATSAKPPRKRGDWCRFAPCRVTCALWTGPLLDLTAIGRPPVTPTANDWGVFLANAKRLVDSALQYQKEIDAALMEHLKGGGTAPGFALKQMVKNRKWLEDADVVAAALKKLGLSDDKIWQKKLQTFTVVDAAAKRLRVTVPDDLRPRPETSDLALTYEGDPAAVDVKNLAPEFSAALKRLAGA